MSTLIEMVKVPESDHWECPRCGDRISHWALFAGMFKTVECNCAALGVPENYWRTHAKEASNVPAP